MQRLFVVSWTFHCAGLSQSLSHRDSWRSMAAARTKMAASHSNVVYFKPDSSFSTCHGLSTQLATNGDSLGVSASVLRIKRLKACRTFGAILSEGERKKERNMKKTKIDVVAGAFLTVYLPLGCSLVTWRAW